MRLGTATILIPTLVFAVCAVFALMVAHISYVRARMLHSLSSDEIRYLPFIGRCMIRRIALLAIVAPPLIAITAVRIDASILASRETNAIRDRITVSTRLVVRSVNNSPPYHRERAILYETSDRKEIEELAQRIAIGLSGYSPTRIGRPDGWYLTCGCGGDMTFDFYRGDELLYSFSYLHGFRIRIKNEPGDKTLSIRSRIRIRRWLEQRGIPQHRRELAMQMTVPTNGQPDGATSPTQSRFRSHTRPYRRD